jgi:flavin-dependent dehydrogenase
MLDHAADAGCQVWQETQVKSAIVSDEGVKVTFVRGSETHELSARWIFDASGRDAFLGKQMQLPKTDLGLPKKFAGDYTYRHLQNAGPRWLLIGDAAGFIDPIFSSGVMLAIKSGHRAAQETLAADRAGTALSASAQVRYTPRLGKRARSS